MEGICKARYIRFSPIKISQVLKIIRGKRVDEVFNILENINKSCALEIKKAVKSALSNAKGLKTSDKFILKECFVTRGPFLKRIMPRAFGRAAMFTHKTAHLTVIVSDEK